MHRVLDIWRDGLIGFGTQRQSRFDEAGMWLDFRAEPVQHERVRIRGVGDEHASNAFAEPVEQWGTSRSNAERAHRRRSAQLDERTSLNGPAFDNHIHAAMRGPAVRDRTN